MNTAKFLRTTITAMALSAFLAAGVPHAASQGLTTPPEVIARTAVVMDAATGTLLYGKNPDLALPPASLAKLVTLHVVYGEIAAGRLSPDELVEIDRRDCSPYVPYGSSIMYLHPGMKVSVRDLMLGAAVVSGNDAAFSLARRISGSYEAFTERMNQAVREMGFDGMLFTEPSGISELSLVSAREFAKFCTEYLRLHPQSLAELHSVKSIEFPRAEHAAPGFVPEQHTVQYNRNPLIFSYPGADGLKTGYIIEVGFNMAATAMREGTRFVVVTLGGNGSSYASGGARRTRDSTLLLDWAFANFKTVAPDYGMLPQPRVWFGASRRVELKPAGNAAVTVPSGTSPSVSVRVEAPRYIDGPVAAGSVVGRLVYSADGKDIRSVDLVAAESVGKAGFFRRAIDWIARLFTGIFGGGK